MPTFKRNYNTGLATIIIGKKKFKIRPGDEIECEESDLHPFESKFTLLTDTPRRKKQTELEKETARYYEMMIEQSWVLNPNFRIDYGSSSDRPKSLQGLRQYLAKLSAGEYKDNRLFGDLGLAQYDLKEAWRLWKHQVESDAKGELELKKPIGRHLDEIARATARKNVVEAEIKEISKRIQELEEIEESAVELDRSRRQLRGSLTKRGGKYIDCDGYKIEYRDGKPFIPEMDLTLKDYLEKVKAHKARRAAAKRPSKKASVVTV